MAEKLKRWTRVNPHTGCHEWTGVLLHGYGSVSSGVPSPRKLRAHRAAYEMAYGPIPDGLVIDHLCRNTTCCNPAHMEAVPHRENTMRGNGPAARNAKKTRCPKGHPYDEPNTYVAPNGDRYCRTCIAARWPKAREQRARVAALKVEAREPKP